MPEANREYKDRLFKFIFGNPENKEWTLSLYNAIHGTSYTNPDDIQFNTIDDAVYMGMKNDLSYIIHSAMEIYEQQSSYNPNMPMRFFLYSGSLYEKYIASTDYYLYSSKLQKIPRPACICFYNGTQDEPERQVLRLSDAYDGDGDIEVCVTMLNVNYGKNKALMDACEPLKEYAWLVDTVRKYQKEKNDLESAIDATIEGMPEDYVIKPFIVAHQAEVKKMFITEYDQEKVLERGREEAKQEGRIEGKREGRIEGKREGRDEMQVEVASDMLKDGTQPVSYISKISKLSESAVRKLASQMGITTL